MATGRKPILLLMVILAWINVSEGNVIPVDTNATNNDVKLSESDDQQFAEEYATLRHAIIHDLGYTKEFADLVEINLRRAIKEEIERQRLEGVVIPQRHRLRQEE